MNPATTTAAILGASAIATALIVTNASTAGPLEPPAGPVTDTAPSLADLSAQIQAIGGTPAGDARWEAFAIGPNESRQITGPGVVRRVIITAGSGGEFNSPRVTVVEQDSGFTMAEFIGRSGPDLDAYAETFELNAVYTNPVTFSLNSSTANAVILVER